MNRMWDDYLDEIEVAIRPFLSKNIIIFGCNYGGVFVRKYLEKHHNKKVKAMIDSRKQSPDSTILHMYSLYYIYDENDVILTFSNKDIKSEFNEIGQNWDYLHYSDNQIIDFKTLLDIKSADFSASFYDWLSDRYGIDFSICIKRNDLDGEDAHGYYPIDVNVFYDAFREYNIKNSDAAFDFGSGKGAMMLLLNQIGFGKVGGVEYTKQVFDIQISNMKKLKFKCFEDIKEIKSEGMYCFNRDAGEMEDVLDSFNWFTLFNPFGIKKTREVVEQIVESLKHRPRKVFIFYAEPIAHDLIMETNKFDLVKQCKTDFFEGSYWAYVYESKL